MPPVPDALALPQEVFAVGEPIVLQVTLPEGHYYSGPWVGLYASGYVAPGGALSGERRVWYSNINTDTRRLALQAPEEPGPYELRLYDRDDEEYILAIVGFAVQDPRRSSTAGDTVRFTPLPGGSLIEFSASNPAIMCADGNPLVARTADQLLDEAERTLALAPNAGPSPGLPCDLWPVQGSGIPAPDYTGTAPIVVVGSRYDAITPYEWSVELADALGPRATLLTWEGSDHTAAFTGADRCIDDYLLTLLIDGQVPAPDTTCAQRGFVGLQWPDEGEAIVGGVTPGGSADQAGLEVGDIILEADGQPVETGSDVPEGAIGSTLEVKVKRGDEILDVVMERGAPVWELWREAE